MSIDIIEWMGCATGIAGSLLLASRHRLAGWGFILYIVSNSAWMTYGILSKNVPMIVMQVFFMATAVLGTYNWLIKPRLRGAQLAVVEERPAQLVVAAEGANSVVANPEQRTAHAKAA